VEGKKYASEKNKQNSLLTRTDATALKKGTSFGSKKKSEVKTLLEGGDSKTKRRKKGREHQGKEGGPIRRFSTIEEKGGWEQKKLA